MVNTVRAGAGDEDAGDEDAGDPVGYLGPAGTFTHQSLLRDPELAGLRHVPMATTEDVFRAVRDGSVAFGVVPWESSVAGLVGGTVDLLAGIAAERSPFERVRAVRDVALPVRLSLYGRGGSDIRGLEVISSHPHALDQCRGWLRRHVPAATLLSTTSTAAALGSVSADPGGRTAAVASPAASSGEPDVVPLAFDIGDVPNAQTRFVVLGLVPPAAPSGRDRTVLVCFPPVGRARFLRVVFELFATAGVEVQRIESRPTRARLGSYYVLIECPGHVSEPPLERIVRKLGTAGVKVRVLGVLPGPGPRRLSAYRFRQPPRDVQPHHRYPARGTNP